MADSGKLYPGGGGTPILEHGWELPVYWPPFLTFFDPIGSFFYIQLDLIDPIFLQKKIGLSLSHLVPEVIWPKVGLHFHKNLSFDHFEAFVPIFSLIFDLINPLFCSSYIFLTPYFYKTSYPVGSIFSSPAGPLTKYFVSCPPLGLYHFKWFMLSMKPIHLVVDSSRMYQLLKHHPVCHAATMWMLFIKVSQWQHKWYAKCRIWQKRNRGKNLGSKKRS